MEVGRSVCGHEVVVVDELYTFKSDEIYSNARMLSESVKTR